MSHILQRLPVIGESRDRKLLEDASCYIYRQTPQGDLFVHVFQPKAPANSRRPVVVFSKAVSGIIRWPRNSLRSACIWSIMGPLP